MKATIEAAQQRAPEVVARLTRRDPSIAFLYLLIFVALNWRLFAFGSSSQLFIYGDNLSVLNNLYYLFENFRVSDPFATFVGHNGMRGSYPMAEPQNSIFYLPIAAMMLAYRLFSLGPVGLYYLLLISHLAHMIVGTYFVFRIANRLIDMPRHLSFVAGLIYMGIGWNAGSFGTNTLSYMTGLIPVAVYMYFACLRTPTRARFFLFVFTLSLFLLAGGMVNYFFYLYLNLALLTLLAWRFHVTELLPDSARSTLKRQALLLLVAAPLWALAISYVQIAAGTYVLPDITHANTSYDALSMFGNSFRDLVGVLLPRFGLLGFGTTSNPDSYAEFINANQLYVGMLPLLLVAAAIAVVRSRLTNALATLGVLNLLLSFGGMFFLYDLTLLVPGNDQFRGHYKYFSFVGLYIALIGAVALGRILKLETENRSFRRLINYSFVFWTVLTVASTVVALASLDAASSAIPSVADHYPVLKTATNYMFRTVLLLGLSIVMLYLARKLKGQTVFALLAVVLLLDISVNYKMAPYYDTPVKDLTSRHFFASAQDQTVVNNLNGFSQLYLMPEVVGADPAFMYTAIPNKYMSEYQQQLLDANGSPQASFMRAAGIKSVLTNATLNRDDMKLDSVEPVTEQNRQQFFHYNPNKELHSNWGGQPDIVGSEVRKYTLNKVHENYFISAYQNDADEDKAIDYLKTRGVEFEPIVTSAEPMPGVRKNAAPMQLDAKAFKNEPTDKSYSFPTHDDAGLFVSTIPYSRIWGAKVNGVDTNIERVNFAFAGVRVPANSTSDSTVEFYVKDTRLNIALAVCAVAFIVLLACLSTAALSRRRTDD